MTGFGNVNHTRTFGSAASALVRENDKRCIIAFCNMEMHWARKFWNGNKMTEMPASLASPCIKINFSLAPY